MDQKAENKFVETAVSLNSQCRICRFQVSGVAWILWQWRFRGKIISLHIKWSHHNLSVCFTVWCLNTFSEGAAPILTTLTCRAATRPKTCRNMTIIMLIKLYKMQLEVSKILFKQRWWTHNMKEHVITCAQVLYSEVSVLLLQ